MCVIAYKAKNVRFPSPERIKQCWEENPDGAGIMWRDNNTNKIKYIKGFMRLNKLNKWIAKNKKWLEDVECALHFRITTHGGTSKGNCHPFVCDCNSDPHQLKGEADYVLMHNGILPIEPRQHDISDSAELALRIGRYADPMDVMDIMDELCVGSRIIVFGPQGTMTYGEKFITVGNDGILYSNDHFLNTCDYGWYGRNWRSTGKSCTHGIDPSVRIPKYTGGVVWDETCKSFVEAETGLKIKLEDVDPDFLSDKDYDRYVSMFNDSIESDEVFYDPELVEEAHYYGMSVKQYQKWMYEKESTPKDVKQSTDNNVVAGA